MEEKVCVLTQDPEEFKPGIWALRYDYWYTSMDKTRCGEIDALKKGDKILVTKLGPRVMHVRRYIDPLKVLDSLEEKLND